jgi:hypothetical protein
MGTILEAGKYRAQAIEAALGETDTGKEQVAVRFRLLDADQEITWYGYFTDKTTESTFKALRTAGWKGQDLSDLTDLEAADAPEVTLVIEHEADQQGNMRAKVRWVNGTGGLALKKALDPNKAKAFAARMKAQVLAFDQNAGTPKPTPKRNGSDSPPQEHLDRRGAEESGGRLDDIPFAPFSNL